MNFNKLTYASLLILPLSLMACNSKNNSVTISNMDGNQLAQITDPTKLKVLHENWAKRDYIKVKKMPIFEYTLDVSNNGNTLVWLYSSKGFAMQKIDKQNMIYRVKLPQINQLNK